MHIGLSRQWVCIKRKHFFKKINNEYDNNKSSNDDPSLQQVIQNSNNQTSAVQWQQLTLSITLN